MTRRPALAALALLLGVAAWAGGDIVTNPTTFRPRIVTSAVRPFQPRPVAARPRPSAMPVPPRAPAVPHILALRGVTVEGDVLALPVATGLRLSDALPVPSEPLADLELDLTTGETLTVAIEDPDAAADAGEVWLDASDALAIIAP